MPIREIARQIVEGSAVLLKNEGHFLPLPAQKSVAVFGRAAYDMVISGNGSGAAQGTRKEDLPECCRAQGLQPDSMVEKFYRDAFLRLPPPEPMSLEKLGQLVNSGLMYEIFGTYTPPVEEFSLPDPVIGDAAARTDTALLVIGRNSGGEECDRHLDEDYYLTGPEQQLVCDVTERFPNIVLVLNANGVMDLGWTESYPQIKSILFIGIPGEQGMPALADILTGRVDPSGKLAFTIARRYADYPSARHFTWDKHNSDAILTYDSYGLDAAQNGSTGFAISPVTVYAEDIYFGYRYFETFGVEPLFAFGHGLSYTTFERTVLDVTHDETCASLHVRVKNTGAYPGKDVVQIYASADREIDRPARKLVAFEKTEEILPGEWEDLTVTVPWKELAAYHETTAAWEISSGDHLLQLGGSSRCVSNVAVIHVPETILISQCANRLAIKECNQGKLDLLTAPERKEEEYKAPWTLTLNAVRVPPKVPNMYSFPQVDSLTDSELAALCVGYGPGIPFSAFLDEELPNTLLREDGSEVGINDHPTGFNGYVSPAMPEKNIHSVFYKDGPAGIGETAWPTEMLIACSFDRKLWHDLGVCVSQECEKQQVDVWLAPAVNLHRNPLGGRCFEYFSEDPFLTGTAAVAVARGVQESGKVLVCPKHFAANEQETFRRGNAKRNVDAVDTIASERALRELYLKPFQMLVEDAGILCIMTSFNKINGTFAGGSKDLCTHILREEWGFEGVVLTDWGDMDTVVDGADAVSAGNDVVMPGGPPVIRQILNGLEQGRVTRADMIKAVKNLLTMIHYTGRNKK